MVAVGVGYIIKQDRSLKMDIRGRDMILRLTTINNKDTDLLSATTSTKLRTQDEYIDKPKAAVNKLLEPTKPQP